MHTKCRHLSIRKYTRTKKNMHSIRWCRVNEGLVGTTKLNNNTGHVQTGKTSAQLLYARREPDNHLHPHTGWAASASTPSGHSVKSHFGTTAASHRRARRTTVSVVTSSLPAVTRQLLEDKHLHGEFARTQVLQHADGVHAWGATTQHNGGEHNAQVVGRHPVHRRVAAHLSKKPVHTNGK
jgi:hypothetical protein